MSVLINGLLAVTMGGAFAAAGMAQTPDPPSRVLSSGSPNGTTINLKTGEKRPVSDMQQLQARLDQAQAQIQQQQEEIERLQKSLQESIATLREQQSQLQASVQETKALAFAAKEATTSTTAEIRSVNEAARGVKRSMAEQTTRITALESPETIHYKGLSITPGGYLEASELVRSRNENADMASGLSIEPLNGSSNSKLTEYRGSVRGSRLSMLVETQLGGTKLSGYIETDFLGAAPTSNYVQSSAFTPRLRQTWARAEWSSGWSFTAGQLWSLATTNRHGMDARAEYIPPVMEANYVVGWTWTRQRAVRIAKNFHDRIWAGFEIDEPESAYSAAYVPANVMGLNTSQNTSTGVLLLPYLPNYSFGNSTTMAPDLVAKVVFEPGWGHYEIKAVGRFFRDRLASTATTPGRMNYTEGYGVGFGAVFPVVKNKLDIELEGMAGQGIGRYGAAAFPDVTLDPVTGAMRGLRGAHVMTGLEYHPRKNLDWFLYAGDEYAARYAMVAPDGSAAGYGSPLVSYAGCTNEVAMNTCSGANRNIYEVTAGYWFKLYQGRFGRFQYGNQVEYLHRTLWSGSGHTPQGGDLVMFSTLRFYLP